MCPILVSLPWLQSISQGSNYYGRRSVYLFRSQCKLLESCNQNEVESIWISMRPHNLPKQITSIVLKKSWHANIITGDFNHHMTGLKSKDKSQANHLKQLVTLKTRDSGALDWFFTNRPKLFSVSQRPKSHHLITIPFWPDQWYHPNTNRLLRK